MVKAGCGECQGCSDCCRGMGNSIFLDPMDIYRLTTGLECTFEDLLSTCVELQVVDGFIQPNMKMTGKEEQCPFLNEKGRCNIHAIRPGICRLFPLGRCYDGEGGFQYFLQIYECKKEPKSKVKIKNWLGVEEIGRYENFVAQWHYFQKDAQKVLGEISQEALVKKLHLYLLTLFYQKPMMENGIFTISLSNDFRKQNSRLVSLDKQNQTILVPVYTDTERVPARIKGDK